ASGYFRALVEGGVGITQLRRLLAVAPSHAAVEVTLGLDGSDWRETRTYDAVVADFGTEPVTELYDALRKLSSNGGAIDYDALLDGQPQELVLNEGGAFPLFRGGDAGASRGVSAAVVWGTALCSAPVRIPGTHEGRGAA